MPTVLDTCIISLKRAISLCEVQFGTISSTILLPRYIQTECYSRNFPCRFDSSDLVWSLQLLLLILLVVLGTLTPLMTSVK